MRAPDETPESREARTLLWETTDLWEGWLKEAPKARKKAKKAARLARKARMRAQFTGDWHAAKDATESAQWALTYALFAEEKAARAVGEIDKAAAAYAVFRAMQDPAFL